MGRTLRLAATVLIILSAADRPAFAQQRTAELPSATVRAIDEVFRTELEKGTFVGGAIGILRDGQVVLTKGYGAADWKAKRPVTSATVFNWASNSKPFIATAAMQLAQSNKLDLDADVRSYVPEFPQKPHVIRVRHLLTHQSGLPHYSNGKIVPTPRKAKPLDELDPIVALHRFDQSPLLFKPGERTEYSTYAYILLTAVVQRAGGEPIAEQLQKRLVDPIGMPSFQLDMPTRDQPNWTKGYRKQPNGSFTESAEEANYWKHGGGGYKCDIRDFARWGAAMLSGSLLDRPAQQVMWTPQSLSSGEATSYGLGPLLDGAPGTRGFKVHHNGAQREASSRLAIYPNARHGIVFLSNTDGVDVGRITTAVYRVLDRN